MNSRDTFLNLSPLDHRYWSANRELFDALAETLSERAALGYAVRAEAALLRVHVVHQLEGDPELLSILEGLEEKIDPEAVYAEEEKTRHNVRALVNVISSVLPEKLRPWVHLGATSVDILDTAMAMRVRDAVRKTLLPLVLGLLEALMQRAREEAETPQVGRTHGQWAVPITFGFALSEYVSRLGQSAVHMENLSRRLCGKLSGAVGAYNATGLIASDPEALEKEYLEYLGLTPAEYANQIVEPEPLLRLLLEINIAFGVIANLADDLRHLQRSEIAEVRESFGSTQVGSSTMPQKRNPWNCEHVKSLWKAFSPRVGTFFMDQISEHQRDLSNSASGRFVSDYLAGFAAATARMKSVIDGLDILRERMAENLREVGDGILAEPTYVLVALTGRPDAHELIRKATLKAERTDRSLSRVLREDEPEIYHDLTDRLSRTVGMDPETFFTHPENYRGLAGKRTRDLTERYTKIVGELKKELEIR